MLTEEQKDFYRLMATYWGAALVLLFAIIALAGIDAWAISRYGMPPAPAAARRAGAGPARLAGRARRHQDNGER